MLANAARSRIVPLAVNGSDIIAAPRVRVPAASVRWRAVRSSGPGGQNVNKVATKVELRVALTDITGLGPRELARLRSLAGSRLTTSEELVLTSAKTRDQSRNLNDARAKLHDLLVAAQQLPRPRRATRPSRRVVRRRLNDKRIQGEKKRLRGPVKAE